MGYRVSGILKLPDGTPANNAEIEFISRKNFSPLVQELKSNILCVATGAYDVTLEFGEYAVIVYAGGTYPAALGTITVAADTPTGQDLPSLLQQSGWQPATPEYIQQIGAWLAEANASATSSAASASAAKVSETSAKSSESAALSSKSSAASSATTATTKASEAASSASAALTSENAAATSETSALASKNSAATSAATAGAGASTATTKASEASASATAAKVSQDAARVSETNAAASAGAVASAIVTHEEKADAHPIGGVTGLQTALDGKYSPANKPTAADIQNVVSPVSSGGIIERGSNANGEYVKFADGTMICTGLGLQGVFSPPIIYVVATYAAAFVEINSVATQVGFTDLGYNLPLTFSGPTVYNVTSKTGNLVGTNIGILSNSIFTQGNADITRFGYTATGRWK